MEKISLPSPQRECRTFKDLIMDYERYYNANQREVALDILKALARAVGRTMEEMQASIDNEKAFNETV